MENSIIIYTDGSCLKNPGPGGWAYLLKYKDKKSYSSGFEPDTTNNRMELTAVIKALESIKKPFRIILHTDSEYIYNAFIKNWLAKWEKNGFISSTKTPVKNKDLWEKLSELNKKYNIEWVKVKAHADDEDNNFVDELARKAAISQKEQNPPYQKEIIINNTKFIIRNMKYSDLPHIKKINDKTLNKQGKLEKQGISDKGFDSLFDKHSTPRVLDLNGKIIGFYWLYYSPDFFKKYFNDHYNLTDTAYLIAIAIDSKYQNKGLGKLLMNDIYEFAKKNNKDKILLDTAYSNKRAYSWYLKEGFYEADKQIFMLKDMKDV